MTDTQTHLQQDRQHALDLRRMELEAIKLIDAEVEAFLALAARRRRLAIQRATYFERMAGPAGGVARPIADAPAPWWMAGEG